MSPNNKALIAVTGATGQQGGGVVRALQASGQFKVRALSRNPARHHGLADEVVEADLNRRESLIAAFEGAHGVFLVTNFWEEGTDELKQATAAVRAAKDAGVWCLGLHGRGATGTSLSPSSQWRHRGMSAKAKSHSAT